MTGLSEWFANTRVRNKILLGYAVMLSFMILIAVVVAIQAARVRDHVDRRAAIEDLLLAGV